MTKLIETTVLTTNCIKQKLRVLVITSCTGEKRFKSANQLTIEDFKNVEKLNERSKLLVEFSSPAAFMYTGMQHVRVMEGVNILRSRGPKKKKDSEPTQELAGEIADIMFAVVCLANSQGIDLQEAFEVMMAKYTTTDKERYKSHTEN